MSAWISLDEISNDLGIPKRTINYYKSNEDFPPVYQFGKRNFRVKLIDYEIWKDQKIIPRQNKSYGNNHDGGKNEAS